jgi:uncharacterized protein
MVYTAAPMIKAFFVTLVLAVTASRASAIDRQCGAKQFWNPTQGACVQKPARKVSADEKHQRAIAILEGKVPRASAAEGLKILTDLCDINHAASCEILAFLFSRGRFVEQDETKAAALYDRSCALGWLIGCVDGAALALRTNHPDVARKTYAIACDRGSGSACARAGEMVEQGAGGNADAKEASRLYERAFATFAKECPSTNTACHELGVLYWKGRGVVPDDKKAYAAWVAGCSGGDGRSCFYQAQALEQAYGVTEDKTLAIATYDIACERYDNADACESHAARLGDKQQDLSNALAHAKRACELDDSNCGTLGGFYSNGLGIEKDDAIANTYYTKSCEHGNNFSCSRLGSRRRDGIGGAKDNTIALQAFDRVCSSGDSDGCVDAAKLLIGIGEKLEQAFHYADQGCDRKNGAACRYASLLVAAGNHGKPADAARAGRLMELGCTLNDPPACNYRGEALENGNNVEKNVSAAVATYRKACDGSQFSAVACENLARLQAAGSGDDVPKAPLDALKNAARACQYGQDAACTWLPAFAVAAKPNDDVKAATVKSLDTACSDRVELACIVLGDIFSSDSSLAAVQPKRGFDYYAGGCGRSNALACDRQANAYRLGIGVATSMAKAQEIWKQLCDNGEASACSILGQTFFFEKKYTEGSALMVSACEKKIAGACNGAGYSHYVQRGATWDVLAARKYYQQACELGEPFGCSNLGELYELGIGVAVDKKIASQFYEKGCTDQSPRACGRVARMILAGATASKDLMRVEAMYRRSCGAAAGMPSKDDTGAPEACRELADFLEQAPMPPHAEIARLRAAALQLVVTAAADNPYYMWVLGDFHRDGVATVKDNNVATQWYVKACDGFDPMGCVAAGKAFRDLSGADNRGRAKLYFERACGAGVEAGCQGLNGTLPGGVRAKGCGCQGSAGGASTSLLAVLLLGLVLRRRQGLLR